MNTTEIDTLAALDFNVEALESMDAPWNWDAFFGGVGLGLAIVGLALAAT